MRAGQPPDLSSIVREVAEPDPEHPLPEAAKEFDVFISHATEDKRPLGNRPLVVGLDQHGATRRRMAASSWWGCAQSGQARLAERDRGRAPPNDYAFFSAWQADW